MHHSFSDLMVYISKKSNQKYISSLSHTHTHTQSFIYFPWNSHLPPVNITHLYACLYYPKHSCVYNEQISLIDTCMYVQPEIPTCIYLCLLLARNDNNVYNRANNESSPIDVCTHVFTYWIPTVNTYLWTRMCANTLNNKFVCEWG